MRKILAMIMALTVILSLATTAFAAPTTTYSITIDSDKTGHIYEAYQIFKGTLEGKIADNDNVPDTEAILTDIEWADGVVSHLDDTAEEVALKLSTGEMTAQDLIDLVNEGKIELGASDGISTYDESKKEYVIKNLPAGYYLVKDRAVDDASVVYTEFILEVVEDSTVNPKGTVPEVEKKIKDINDSTELNISDKVWQDSADHDVGDTIPYKLEATLADNLEIYKPAYNLVFHDLLSPGLTYQEITSAKIINPDGTEIDLFTDHKYTENYKTVNDDPKTTDLIEASELTVAINDVKALGGKNGCKVVIEYNALLNEDAVVGSLGNPNEVYLTFSRNPYEGTDYGETPKDRVIAFTYKVVVNKVREDGLNADGSTKYVPLSGATFELKKWVKGPDKADGSPDGTWKTLQTVDTNPDTEFTFSGLDDGWYCLTETKAPDGYNAIETIYFRVDAKHDVLSEAPQLTELKGTETTSQGPNKEKGDLGTFEIVHNEEKQALITDIVNKAGIQLPETGGIGTTIFYAAGALMVLCAVILLITKKRMNIAE